MMRGGGLFWIVVVGLGVWALIGSPSQTIAGWFWPNDAAPWETVDAFYYPNRNDLTEHREATGLQDVFTCRDWVRFQAAHDGDPSMTRSDYECGIGTPYWYGMLRVYRATVD